MEDYTIDDVKELDERVSCKLDLTAFEIAKYGQNELYNMAEAEFNKVGLNLEILEMEMIPTKIEEHYVSYDCIPIEYTITFSDGEAVYMKDGVKLNPKIKKVYCECCDSAWIEILDECQETYYVCNMCRDNEPDRFTENNSSDCNIPFDIGN